MTDGRDPIRPTPRQPGDAVPGRPRRGNRTIITAVIGAFVVIMVGVLIWTGTRTADIDPTPEATSGPPGPGSIGDNAAPPPNTTGSTTNGEQPAANPTATE